MNCDGFVICQRASGRAGNHLVTDRSASRPDQSVLHGESGKGCFGNHLLYTDSILLWVMASRVEAAACRNDTHAKGLGTEAEGLVPSKALRKSGA